MSLSPFNWRGQSSTFLVDPVFNGRNLGLAQRSQALGIGMGPAPSQASINTITTKPVDKRSRPAKARYEIHPLHRPRHPPPQHQAGTLA